jgi:hypothetical protein
MNADERRCRNAECRTRNLEVGTARCAVRTPQRGVPTNKDACQQPFTPWHTLIHPDTPSIFFMDSKPLKLECRKSAGGQAQSKTLSRVSGQTMFRQVLDCACPLALCGAPMRLKRPKCQQNRSPIDTFGHLRTRIDTSNCFLESVRIGGRPWLTRDPLRLCPSSVAGLLRRVDAFALNLKSVTTRNGS